MRILTYSEVRGNLKSVLDSTIDDADVTIIHRRDGENAVVMGEAYYNSLKETLYLLSNPANAQAIFKGIEQDKAGDKQVRELIQVDDE
jgi:antitoxin YefM